MAKEQSPQEQIQALETAAFAGGKAEARTEMVGEITTARKEGRAEGAEQERERIRAVEAVGLPGHEALIEELKYDGKTTGPEAALRVLTAEKTARERRLANLKADAPAPVPEVAAPPAADSAEMEAKLPIEERCKKQWDRDAELRDEFSGNFGNFVGFSKAEAAGRVQILSKARQ